MLLTGKKMPSNAWRKKSFRLKFFGRSLLFWPSTSGLLHTLASNPQLDAILTAQPSLPCKLHRPYLAANINRTDGLFALRDHYTLTAQRMPQNVYHSHLNTFFVLSQAQGKEGEQITLRLTVVDKLNKEGETTLQLCNTKGIVLANVTFTLMNYQQQPTLFIGGLQGPDCAIPHTEIQETTKACYGLFPKRLVLEGISYLARQLSIRQVLAVSNTTHIYQNWRYHNKKQSVMYADYDQFWRSLGGQQLDNGHFLLPMSIPRKTIEQIASKKRAEYRRRYQLLDELQLGVEINLPHKII